MKLNCHCGAVEAEIGATINELAKIVKCNCSICKRKNANRFVQYWSTNKTNKAVAMKGLTLSILHLHFAFRI